MPVNEYVFSRFAELPANVIPGKDQEPYVYVIANVRKDSVAGK